MNGCQLAGVDESAPAPMTISTTATLMTTITALTVADSLTPRISSAVTATVMSTAGRLKTAVTGSPPATVTSVPGAALSAAGKLHAQLTEQRHEIAGPADGDRGGAERVLEDQVPADDPGDELAERRVGIGVGRAGDRHARSELRVAERRQHARQPGQDHRQHDRRPGIRRRGLAGQHEDAGADDGADAEHDELARPQHAGQTASMAFELFRLNVFNGLGRKNRHQDTPAPAWVESP